MNLTSLQETLRRLLSAFPFGRSRRGAEEEPPLRAALFGLAQLESHARLLATGQQIAPKPGPERLLERLKENADVLRESYNVVAAAVFKGRHAAPAAEWLLDNYYLIEDQIALLHDHLPPGYSRQLPRLRSGAWAGYPRVYELALELVSHTDGQVDMENLTHFVRAFQTTSPLKLGELWAVAIMLRLALIENLRRVARRIALQRQHRDAASEWVDRFLGIVHRHPKELITELADFVRSGPPMSQAFIAELVSGMQGEHPALGLVVGWIEQELAERGQTIEQVLRAESQDQAADQVSIGNCFTSLRTLGALDWHVFVESQSATAAELHRDPSGIYAPMDFHTRDRYRHVVERLARSARRDEPAVAAAAVRLAAERGAGADPSERHVGYFLIGPGLAELEAALAYRPPLHRRVGRRLLDHALGLYIVLVAVTALTLVAALGFWIVPAVLPYGWGWLVPLGLGLLMVAVQTCGSLLHWAASLLVPPRCLPRMDFAKGIPDEHRTAVVVPTMIPSARAVDTLLEDLEIRYLANRDPNLAFGLLTDFTDASVEVQPDDNALVERAAAGVRHLNEKYAGTRTAPFFLLHRPRRWNAAERCWMGWERKRGKLQEFNRLLREGRGDGFTIMIGDLGALRTVRYVITLDTDTQLPPETAWKMVGAMAHPLNRPQVDAATRCVRAGYGILQPRVAISLAGASRSPFARLFAGEVGLDPYTREVSSVSQDYLGRGHFIGKGIYDVAAFDDALRGRFPENRILSHDLIEGCHARCGFLNDVELIEDHPSSYLAEASRRHRWVRGDWQIAAWMFRRSPGPQGGCVANPLDRVSRWLVFDNLRRSLVPPARLGVLAAGWLAAPLPPLEWTLVILAMTFAPDLARGLWLALRKPPRVRRDVHVRHAAAVAGRAMAIEALHLAVLPFEAALHLDAIGRAAWRMLVSRRRLLQWQTAQDADRQAWPGLATTFRTMLTSPLTGVAVATAAITLRPSATPEAVTAAAVWLAGPVVAWFLSRATRVRPARLTAADLRFLWQAARRTWGYFDQFVGAEHNWLPPDNFQEQPEPKVAARTSPTNIGQGLLATLAACDLGFVSTAALADRTGKTLDTLDRLDRHRGHFLNWYDTRSCHPLHPAYISTVDSGNLAGSLIALGAGLQEQRGAPVLPRRWREGLRATLGVLAEELATAREQAEMPPLRVEFSHASDAVLSEIPALADVPDALPAVHAALARLSVMLSGLEPACSHDSEAAFWLAAARRHADDLRGDLEWLLPHLTGPTAALPASAAPPSLDAAALRDLHESLLRTPTLADLAALDSRLAVPLGRLLKQAVKADKSWEAWLRHVRDALAQAGLRAAKRIEAFDALALRCTEFAEYDIDFLYDSSRRLLAIGYSLDARHRDTAYYDLLASEARLASYLGVAKGKLPLEHWFNLGRPLASADGALSLMSWSGSMFEYLMPVLLMPSFPGTLLERACRGAVTRQIAYGRRRLVPWGISESCYNQVDAQMNYQYRAFGTPDLGLKRGLSEDLVIAPYASALALTVLPEKACANLRTLARQQMLGRYGFYESVDYTAARLPGDQTRAIIRCTMAHHAGMSLQAINHLLADRPMQRRFLADPEVRAALLLLEERVPAARERPRPTRAVSPLAEHEVAAPEETIRVYTTADLPIPEGHLLSNGRYHVLVTSSGSGFSRWENFALTRWREDATCDPWGSFIYLQDVEDGHTWSVTPQPNGRRLERFEAVFSQGRAEFRGVCRQVGANLQVAVSPEDDIEVRRLTLTNLADRPRTLEVTTFAEVVLAEPRAELSHPVFNSLFIETEALPDRAAVLATRRRRSADETPPWLIHLLTLRGDKAALATSFETDRARFLGRNRTAAAPRAMAAPGPLSNTAGAVLDPCAAVRVRVELAAGESVVIDAVTGVGGTRDAAVALADRYRDYRLADRVFELAWTQSQVFLHQLRATEAEAQLFSRLASAIIFAHARTRAKGSLIARNTKGQADLWRYGISGDLPIVLLRVTDASGLDLVRKVVQAHAYWRHKGLRTDLVIWADAFAGYRQSLLDQIMGLVASGPEARALNQHGGVFVRSTDQLPEDDQTLLQAVARLALSDRAGTLAAQAARRPRGEPNIPNLHPSRQPSTRPASAAEPPPRELVAFNGLGGFTPDGREYVTVLRAGDVTPAPWSNVLANAGFGTVVTESGGGYTWFENAHEYRLTPWYNDPVGDPSGEAFYVRDEETGRFWSPSPAPARGPTPYVCRHGLGYTVFEHAQDGIASEMWTYVPIDAPVKCVVLTLRNETDRDRPLSVTGFAEWVLGENRDRDAMHVVTRVDPQTGAILASNAFNGDFAGRVAFFHSSAPDRGLTGDRTEFLGRNRSTAAPAALRRSRLSGHVGAALDPCAAIQAFLTIPAGQQRQVVFVLGAAHNEHEAHDLLKRFADVDGARQALEAVWGFWNHLLGGVYVETPDPSVNFLANHWLLYQTLASRFWGRSGYYQSGGAFGFRDQLQDAMATIHECPWLLRQHLLDASARQFREGDVQHWWHPPTGRGVRTRCSDDFLWLPYAACRYVEATGDTGVLDEPAPFLEGRPLPPGEESSYDLPHAADERAPLYEHCLRAVRYGLRFGPHGLPLIGAGDWNDGLNRVGLEGRGESVWLGFFLLDVLARFAVLAAQRNDTAAVQQCEAAARTLRANVEAHAWDGGWYRRAYFDDGRALGSADSPECRIDSLPQSWAVLSGAADPARAATAMQAVMDQLADSELRLVRLFRPPFDTAPWDPGYIKGYVPGVRENGGQYTHAAIWVAMALARQHNAAEAWRVLSYLSPIRHGDSAESIARYKVEPYVATADVYTARGHEGRGGWTWYTGSAAWMYRLILESLLGITRQVDTLTLAPVLPPEWKGFAVHYRYYETTYHIAVTVAGPETWTVRSVVVDEVDQPDGRIHMVNDHQEHAVRVVVG